MFPLFSCGTKWSLLINESLKSSTVSVGIDYCWFRSWVKIHAEHNTSAVKQKDPHVWEDPSIDLFRPIGAQTCIQWAAALCVKFSKGVHEQHERGWIQNGKHSFFFVRIKFCVQQDCYLRKSWLLTIGCYLDIHPFFFFISTCIKQLENSSCSIHRSIRVALRLLSCI